MTHFKKISTTLSVAATVLLESCSSSGSDSAAAPAAVANTTAPELVGTWATGCVATSVSNTTTQASGGGGSVSGGAAFSNTAVFTQDGHIEYTTESYATSNCNVNTLAGSGLYKGVYFVGEAGFASDGSPVTEFSYSNSSSMTYSIFQVVSSISLYLGDPTASTTGNNGSSQSTRIDGLGEQMPKL